MLQAYDPAADALHVASLFAAQELERVFAACLVDESGCWVPEDPDAFITVARHMVQARTPSLLLLSSPALPPYFTFMLIEFVAPRSLLQAPRTRA